MPEYRSPGVYVEEIASGARAIEGVPTSTAAFAGGSRIGPVGRAQVVRSFAAYQRAYGAPDNDGLLGWSVRQFFANGGTRAVIVRIARKLSGRRASALEPGTPAFAKALLPASGRGGLYLLDEASDFSLLCVPGETNPAVIARLQAFCLERRAFLLVDCARDATVGAFADGPDVAITGGPARNSALYFPWLVVRARKARLAIPPCGFVAGVYARIDAQRGIWKAPAGAEAQLTGALDVTAKVTDRQQGELNPRAVNCIRHFKDRGIVVWGARTLDGTDPEWKYVAIRRLIIFIEKSIYRGTQWVVFEPNAEPTWKKLRSSVENFLIHLWRDGAFPGRTPAESFFVNVGLGTTMTQSDIDQGILIGEVGVAPSKPAEFVILRFMLKTAT
jgi:phage tail sheath protein FI